MTENLENIFFDLTSIQLFKLQLLTEVHEFCIINDIKYSITDELLVAILRHEPVNEQLHDVSIIMSPEDYQKYLHLTSLHTLPSKRIIENIHTNKLYPTADTRYVATNTLSVNLVETPYINNGLFITIKPMHHTSKLINNHTELSQAGLEYLFHIKGIEEPISIPAEEYNSFIQLKINDFKFNISNYFIRLNINLSPRVSFVKYKRISKQFHIESDIIDHQEFTLATNKTAKFFLAYTMFFDRLYFKIIQKLENSPYSLHRYLRYFSFNFYSFKFKKELLTKKQYLLDLYDSNDIENLTLKLKEYSYIFEYFYQYENKILYIDNDLLKLYLFIQRSLGKTAYADDIAERIKYKFDINIEKIKS